MLAGIALPNAGSQALHSELGFSKFAQFEQVGFKLGEWITTEWWQKTLPAFSRESDSAPTPPRAFNTLNLSTAQVGKLLSEGQRTLGLH